MTVTDSSSPSGWDKHVQNFDIDNYINFLIPRPRLHLLPRPVSHFLGYRPADARAQKPLANPLIWLSGCVGGFICIAIISAVYHALPLLGGHQAPIVIASFGAAAILEYNTIESPLSQPRNLIFGHLLSTLIGVSVTKGFARLPPARFDQLRWLAGAVSVGLASFVMGVTKTVHPPAGATALLAATSVEITVLGWWLLPLVLLASVLMLASALLVNNFTRKWPAFWWTPADLTRKKTVRPASASDVEKHAFSNNKRGSLCSGPDSRHIENADARSDTTLGEHDSMSVDATLPHDQIVISRNRLVVPGWIHLSDWEKEVLEEFRQKLQC